MADNPAREITGKCYCGAITFCASAKPQRVAYCHCTDCRRATGGPVAAFAGFADGEVTFEPTEGKRISVSPGVVRTFCEDCGSSLTGRYGYLPDQVYVSIGIIDQAGELAPEIHAHEARRLPWLHIVDDADRLQATARGELNDNSGN